MVCSASGFQLSEIITAGLDGQYEPTKINLPTNQRAYDKSETTDEKLSARRIQIFRVYFCVVIF